MKKRSLFVLTFLLIMLLPSMALATSSDTITSGQYAILRKATSENALYHDDISITSNAAILMDSSSNKVLYHKNADKKMPPASTTKIMTAILALENCNLEDMATASYDAIMSIPEGYSSADLQVGEQLSVQELIQVLLVHSANDAANVLAEFIGGSIDSFVSMMNTKAHELSLNDTHFTNAYGKHDENHYISAQDLAMLMKYCMKNDDFRKIAGSASCSISATNLSAPRLYSNTNYLIVPHTDFYTPYVTAGKTGYTSQAKNCLVSCAYQNDLELICVVLGSNSSDVRFAETKQIYEYGYDNFEKKSIFTKGAIVDSIEIENATKETKQLDVATQSDITLLLKTDTPLEDITPTISIKDGLAAPISEGEIVGTIQYVIDDETYKTNLVATHDVQESKWLFYGFIIIGIGIILAIFILKTMF